MTAIEVGERPECEDVFFLWTQGSRAPIPSILWGESPPLRRHGDRPFVLAAHVLPPVFREQVEKLRDCGGGASQVVPWVALAAAFPPPADCEVA